MDQRLQFVTDALSVRPFLAARLQDDDLIDVGGIAGRQRQRDTGVGPHERPSLPDANAHARFTFAPNAGIASVRSDHERTCT